MKQWVNMGGVVRLQKLGGVTFRLKSQPVLISAMTTTLLGATPPEIQAAQARFSQKKTLC